ncbi:hypothetical protein ACQ4PT_066431 [Festuca glaucescens]
MASAEGRRAPPGAVFNLPDHELITKFLRPKVARLPIDGHHNIHDFDAYSLSPDQLVDQREEASGTDDHDGKRGHWYFFTPVRRQKAKNGRGRRQRAVGEGYTWHSEHREEPVFDEENRCVGYKMELSYQFKESPRARPTRLGWCMTEYRLNDDAAGLVLCRVCVSRHKTETTYDSVIKAMEDCNKRKAMADCNKSKPMPDCKKRKAGDDPHPDAPRLQTPRRQEQDQGPADQLQAIEHRWLYSDDHPMPAVAAGEDSSVGFSFQDLQEPEDDIERWLLSGQDDAMPPCGSMDPAAFSFQDHLQEPEEDIERWLLSGQDDVMPPYGSKEPAGFSIQDLQQLEDDNGSVDPAGFSDDILQDVEDFPRTQQQPPLVEEEYQEVTYALLFADNDMDLVACSAPAPAFVSCDTPSSHGMACSKTNCEICIQHMVEELMYEI